MPQTNAAQAANEDTSDLPPPSHRHPMSGEPIWDQHAVRAMLSKLRTPAPAMQEAALTQAEIEALCDEHDMPPMMVAKFAVAVASAAVSKLRAPVADTLPLEKALYELVNKIDTGLDTGDLLQDARRASTVLDAIMTGGDLVACAYTFFKECGEDKWRERYERSLDFRIGWNACLDAIAEAQANRAALASAPVAGEAKPDRITSRRPSGVLSMDGASLHIHPDGSGKIIVAEGDFTLEDDRDEGPDGPQGSVHWVARLPASELIALRDFLTGHARPSDDDLWDQTLTERDEYHDMADKLANAIADHLLVEIGEHSSSNCPWMRALEAIENAAPQAWAGCIVVQEADTVPHFHPEYGPGIFFTEDARIEPDAAPQASAYGHTQQPMDTSPGHSAPQAPAGWRWTLHPAGLHPDVYAAAAAHTSDEARNAALEEAAGALEDHRKAGREWVPGSLWDTLSREAAARIRALKSTPAPTAADGGDDVALPPLPHPTAHRRHAMFAGSQMTSYAKEAVLADRQQRAGDDMLTIAYLAGAQAEKERAGDALLAELLDDPLLRDLLGYIEDTGPADVWGAAQAWMAKRNAALAARKEDGNG